MKRLYCGKTKDVYELDNGQYLLQFKDDVTGEGGVFDPGANTVGLTLAGAGQAGLRVSKYFFEMLRAKGIPTHYIASDLEKATMTVKPATAFGHGLEVICRYRAVGSFLRRYGKYVDEGQPLDAFVEVTLKDDERGDPPINEDALVMLAILRKDEYKFIKAMTKKIAAIVKDELAKKGMELYDIKLEFGRVSENEQIVLIDEISGGNMRVFENGKAVEPLALARRITSDS